MFIMKAKHRKTLAAIFAKPTMANIKFSDIESLIKALGGEIREGPQAASGERSKEIYG